MMYRSTFILLLALGITTCGRQQPETDKQDVRKNPNIIYILADDLGYAELGCYGQEKIETPNIDQLAAGGMRFTQHYSGAPVCAPARSVLLTGLHTGHTPVRSNHEWGERGDVWNFEAAAADPGLEGQYPMPDNTVTVASLLQQAGYKTGMVGKWGLGAPLSRSIPNEMGFDFFVGYNCQRQAHTHYPLHLWKNKEKMLLDNALVAPNTKLPEGADPYDIASYAQYTLKDYAPSIMHEEALGFIEANKDSTFFLYYASTISHAPIQAPGKWVDYYHEKFGEEEPYLGDRSYFPHRYPRAGYAAMVSYLDEQVGEIVSKLKELGIYENTIIVFSSDNGPTFNGGTESVWFDSAKPFRSDQGWGKAFVKEGGIRVPMIASWAGHIKAGTTSDHVSAFYDMMPTLCELAGIETPATDGISMVPELLGDKQQQGHDFLYWEFPSYGGQQALRMGRWKGIRSNITDMKKDMTFELYDLEADPTESRDVAGENPEVLATMLSIFEKEHVQSPIPRFRMTRLGDENPEN